MSTVYSRTYTLAVGANTITLDNFGTSQGIHPWTYVKVIKRDLDGELWVSLDGTPAALAADNQESVPTLAAESTMRVSSSAVRSRVAADGSLDISVYSTAAGDITIEAQ